MHSVRCYQHHSPDGTWLLRLNLHGHIYCCCCVLSHVWLFANPWTSPPGFSVHGIFHAGILEWVAISSSRGSSQPRDRTLISCVSCSGKRYHHPKSTLYCGFTVVVYLMSLDRYIKTRIHHCNIQSSVTALKIPCTLPVYHSFFPNPWQPFIFLL